VFEGDGDSVAGSTSQFPTGMDSVSGGNVGVTGVKAAVAPDPFRRSAIARALAIDSSADIIYLYIIN
jgi:hypothetical protein